MEPARRKYPRFPFPYRISWDYYSDRSGAKTGAIENLSSGGCLLHAGQALEPRRWIRMVLHEEGSHLHFTSVGRVVRTIESESPYRYGVEFLQPLNSLIVSKIQSSIALCAECRKSCAAVPDVQNPEQMVCVLCHLRRACHGLLVYDEA